MKCCFCGTARNCGNFLGKVFSNIEKMGTLFEEYVIIVYYDVSDDNTLSFLKKYQETNKNLFIYVNKTPLTRYRTHRIAKGRNVCLNTIRNNYTDYDFFIMMDLDDINSKEVNLEVLKKNLILDTWDALSFVNITSQYYYDIWALAIRPYVISYRHFKDCSAVSTKIHTFIQNKLKNTPKDKLVQCASAFGGFSIYRTNKFINCNYDGRLRLDMLPKKYVRKNIRAVNTPLCFTNSEGSVHEDCEHKSFHLEAIKKNNARIRISPEILFF